MYKSYIPVIIIIILIGGSLFTACKCKDIYFNKSITYPEEEKNHITGITVPAEDMLSQTKIFEDGRTIGFAEYGDPHGKPIFFFHGFPGSRFEAELFHDVALANNIRIIAVDRPGMGLSSFQKDRTLLDWPDDILELADKLGVDDFAVMGISGGGPYAAACAKEIRSSRLKKVGIISAMGPTDKQCIYSSTGATDDQNVIDTINSYHFFTWINDYLTGIAQGYHEVAAFRLQHDTELCYMKKEVDLIEDVIALNSPDITYILYKANMEAFRQGARGVTWDGRIITGSWGFALAEIDETDRVHIWHGEKDKSIPPIFGRCYVENITNCHVHFDPDSDDDLFPGEGHFSLRIKYAEEILTTLTSGW